MKFNVFKILFFTVFMIGNIPNTSATTENGSNGTHLLQEFPVFMYISGNFVPVVVPLAAKPADVKSKISKQHEFDLDSSDLLIGKKIWQDNQTLREAIKGLDASEDVIIEIREKASTQKK